MRGIDTFAEPFEELQVKNVVFGIVLGIFGLFLIKG